MDKLIDMTAFKGRDFDCEFFEWEPYSHTIGEWLLGRLTEIVDLGGKWKMHKTSCDFIKSFLCRPRLNVAQILTDYSGLPDGLVCECLVAYRTDSIMTLSYEKVYSDNLLNDLGIYDAGGDLPDNKNYTGILHIKIIGLRPEYSAQAEKWDYPVIEL